MNYSILEKLFKNTTKNVYLIFLIIFIEFIGIVIEISSMKSKLFDEKKELTLIDDLKQINPYSLFQKLLDCKTVVYYNLCTFSTSAQMYLIFLIFLCYWIFYFISNYRRFSKYFIIAEKRNKKL